MRRDRSIILPRVFRGRDALREGVFSEKQLRGPEVQRVVHGVYTVRGVPLTHQLRCEATALLLPTGAVITGRSQATLLGVELTRWEDDVEVLLPAGGRWSTPKGVTARRTRVIEAGAPWEDVPLASRHRMAFDACTRMELTEAVANLDALVRGGLVERTPLRHWLRDMHDPHVVAARRAADLCDPRAESRPESIVRVILVLADLAVEPRWFVHDAAGRFVARLDLALPEFKVAIEYDGAWHALREQLSKDRHRMRALRDAGWETVHVTADMLADPQSIVDAVRRAVQRQRAARRAA